MQLSPVPQNWRELTYLFLAALITLIPEIYRRYANSKKTRLENDETQMRTGKTAAETQSMRLRDDLAVSEQVGQMLSTLIQTGDELRDLQRRAIQAEADAQVAQLFVDQLNAAAKLAVCEHHPHGVRLSDYTPHQLKSHTHRE
jgi:hypothetical protein